jgi:hypothetical protein
MARRRSFRSNLYRAARLMGDMEAAERGPTSYGKRLVRKRIYRAEGSFTRKLLRGFGLSR